MPYACRPQETILRNTTHRFFANSKHDRDEGYQNFCYNKPGRGTLTHEKDSNTFKEVQISQSTTHLVGPRGYHKKLGRSKSQENNRKKSKEIVMQDEVLEWWEMYRDREKMKKWREKLQQLGEKLKEPGGEEKLRLKVEKYLRRIPSYFSDCDEDSKVFRENLPDNIIRKLKKYYLGENKKYQSELKVLRVEVPKYENIRNNGNYKSIVKKWLKGITVKKRDFLKRTVLKDAIVEFIVHKIEPLILCKPDFDVEFRYILKSNLIDILNEIPIVVDSKDKKDMLNRITDDLIDDLLKNDIRNINRHQVKNVGVNCNFGIRSFEPTEKDIIHFVADELTQFLKKTHVDISPRRIACLERELVDIFKNVINSITLDINKDDVSFILQNIGKLTEYQANHLTNTLIENLNDLFWNIHKKYVKDDKLLKFLTNSGCSDMFLKCNDQKGAKEYDKSKPACINIDLIRFKEKLTDETVKWLERKQIPLFGDVEFKKTVVKDLVMNIAGINKIPKHGFEHVESEVLKWITKLVGDNIMQHINIEDLVERLIRINKSALEILPDGKTLSFVCQNVEVVSKPSTGHNMSYVEELVDIIFDWYHELPYDMVTSVEDGLTSHSIKEVAERIYTRILSKENLNDVIDNEVDDWINDFIQGTPDSNIVMNLKSKIKNVPFRQKLIDGAIVDKDILKRYEDSICDWIDKLHKDSNREDFFIKSKNNFIKEIAARLYEIKRTQGDSSTDFITKKMKREVSEWLVKVPIHPKLNIKKSRDEMANKLLDVIQKCNKPLDNRQRNRIEFEETLRECDIIDWLKKQPLYTENNADDKQKQETYMTALANVLNQIKHGQSLNLDEELVKYIKKLDLKKEYRDDFIQQTVADLKIFLQNLGINISEKNENENLTAIIKQWLHSLPLNITSEQENKMIECLVKELLEVIKQTSAKDSRGNESLIKAIKKIIKVLPIECKTKCNEIFLNHHSKSLLQQLNKLGKTEKLQNENDATKSPLEAAESTEDSKVNEYMRQLTEQIEEWLTNLQLPEHKEKDLRAVVINELAEDIIDRRKYLEMNPSSRGTDIEEIDHLKFQIFKWINKLVGEENLETVEHAPELMQRIRSLRNPLIKTVGNRNLRANIRQSVGAGPSSLGRSSKPVKFEVGQMPILGVPGCGRSMVEGFGKGLEYRRFSDPLGYPDDYIPNINTNNASAVDIQDYPNVPVINQRTNTDNSNSYTLLRPLVHFNNMQSDVPEIPEGTTMQQIYQQYDETFRQRSNEIPLEVLTPEEETVANYIRQGVINIIWNTYFKLKSNPEIENDYRCVEILMEEALDEIFNDLPETDAIKKVKHIWKMNVLKDVIDMLKKVHSITDSPTVKLALRYVKRTDAKAKCQKLVKDILNYIVESTLDIYLTWKQYNERDPIKADIYKQRLTKYIEDLIGHYEFSNITKEQLNELTSKLLVVLDNVPVPGTDILPSELNEMEIGNVIETWFNELRSIDLQPEAVEQRWRRLRQLLARNINALERRIYADESELDRIIMHEASLYLGTDGILYVDGDLHMNEMVEELANRLRGRRQGQVIPEYGSFEQNRPLCSSIIQVNPNAARLPKNRAPVVQQTAIAALNILPEIALNENRPEEYLPSQGVQLYQRPIVANTVESPRILQPELINQPNETPQILVYNGEQIVQREVLTAIHKQMDPNIVNLPEPIPLESRAGVQLNSITDVPGYTSHVGESGPPKRALEVSNLAKFLSPGQGLENHNVQQVTAARPQIEFGTPRHDLQVSNFADQGFVGHLVTYNIPVQGTTRPGDGGLIGQAHNSQIVGEPPETSFPVNEIPTSIPSTRSGTEQVTRSSQVFFPSSNPTLNYRTRSTARIGDAERVMEIVEKFHERVHCTCVERCRCSRRQYVCSCDDDEEVYYVPCKYYF